MSLRTVPKPWSLAFRMAAWYGLTALAVAVAGVAAAYAAVRVAIDRELVREFDLAVRDLHAARGKLDATRLAEAGVARVVSPDGTVAVASAKLDAEFPRAAFPAPGAGPVEVRSADGAPFTLIAEQADGWVYQFALDRSLEAEFFAKLHRAVAFASLPTLAVGLAVGYFLARLGLRPIRRISQTMREVSTDRLDSPLPVEGLPAELMELAESFNAVLARMHEAFARLDQFSADVAHELRTPVHNVRQLAEVVLSSEAGDERQALGRVLDETDRLSRLIERLLLFARLADPRAGVERSEVRIVAELASAVEFYSATASEAGVVLLADAPADLAFPLDAGLFQRAVSNLLANALAHTPAGGTVTLSARASSAGLAVEVADTGQGIAAEDLPRLFDRFHRSAEARASGRGTGLGLPLVRRALELHGGTVGIESAPGSGTRIRLFFPRRAEDGKDVIPLPRP